MANNLSQSFPNREAVVAIEIVPVEGEEDDFDTLAAVERVYAEVQRQVTHLNDYSVRSLPGNERGIDIILLVGLIAANVAANKDLLMSFFNMVSAAIELLSKRGRVQEIELIAEGKTLILRDLSKKSAKDLIEAFEAQHRGITPMLTSSANLKVKAKVSKKGKPKK